MEQGDDVMEFEVKIDTKQLEKMTKAAKEFAPKAIERANRDAIKKGKTTLSKSARERYNMSKKDFEQFVKTRADRIEVESRLLTMGTTTHFSITPKSYISQKDIAVKKRKKATVTVQKGNKKQMRHAFIANPEKVQNTMLWQRDKQTGKISPIKTISAAQIASNKEISEMTLNTMQETQKERLEHYIERELEKHADH